MSAYYNEHDLETAAWLRNNIAAGLIAPGEVDTRSIAEVQPDDLRGFTQHHFFAGIGGWSLAARLAGWPDERPLWSGSCPCQPYSAAGKGLGTDDPRHLWPDLYRLWRAFRPIVGVGEQVAGSAGYGWFDGVRADLAREGISCRVVDIPALAVDAPHQRNRLYWVAVGQPDDAPVRHVAGEMEGTSRQNEGAAPREGRDGHTARHADDFLGCDSGTLADAKSYGGGSGLREDGSIVNGAELANRDGSGALGYGSGARSQGEPFAGRVEGASSGWSDAERADCRDGGHAPADGGDMGHAYSSSAGRHSGAVSGAEAQGSGEGREPGNQPYRLRPSNGRNGSWWAGADWIACHDGKIRRVADASAPLLAHGFPNRILAWRGLGNAIVPPLAAEVLGALMDVLDGPERIAA